MTNYVKDICFGKIREGLKFSLDELYSICYAYFIKDNGDVILYVEGGLTFKRVDDE